MSFHLAEFNTGLLRYDWNDPRVADFVEALDDVNAIAARSPGFIWRMPDEEMEAAQCDPVGALGGNPRRASTLSVWSDLASLEQFVWQTLHRRFLDRSTEWFAPKQGIRMVLWQIPVGHRPTIDEAMQRFDSLNTAGDTGFAFGWEFAKTLDG